MSAQAATMDAEVLVGRFESACSGPYGGPCSALSPVEDDPVCEHWPGRWTAVLKDLAASGLAERPDLRAIARAARRHTLREQNAALI